MNVSFGRIIGSYTDNQGYGRLIREDNANDIIKISKQDSNAKIELFNGDKFIKSTSINLKKGLYLDELSENSALRIDLKEDFKIKAGTIKDTVLNLGSKAKLYVKNIKNTVVDSLKFKENIYEGRKVTLETDNGLLRTDGSVIYDSE